MEVNQLRAPRPEKVLRFTLVGASLCMLFAFAAQTQAYFAGHSKLLISPIFLLAFGVYSYLAITRRYSAAVKARTFALVTGGVVVVMAPASVGALTIGSLFLLLATLVWISSRPNLTALVYFAVTSILAVVSHHLLAVEPETHFARPIMAIVVSLVIAWLAYVYGQMLLQQNRVLDSALRISRQGIMRRYTDTADELQLDSQAQALLGHNSAVLRFFDFVENIVNSESRDSLLSLCSLALRSNDKNGLRVEYANGRTLYVEIFTNDEQQVWLVRDVSAEINHMRDMEILVEEQRETLALLDQERQIREVAITAANLVVYELDVETGYARVLSGQSSWPELWSEAPFINVLGDVLPVSDRVRLESAIANPGQVAELLIRHPQTGQPVYWGQFAFTPVQAHQGRQIQLGYRLITDKLVNARKDAESARLIAEQMYQRLDDIADGGRIGLFRHDLRSDTWECNDIYREFYALPVEEYPAVTTALIDSRFDPETKASQSEERLRARGGNDQRSHDRQLLLPDGSRRELITFVKAEYEGDQIIGMVGSAFDVTKEREAQRELSRANARLSELLERQRSMFAVIGHELRTPVASIEMLSKDPDLSTDEKVDLITGISQGLLNVLEDLRTVVAPERVKAAQEVVDYPSVVLKRALVPLRSLLQEKGIEYHLDLPPDDLQCTFNSQALRQLATNLVKNAAVHSGASNVYVTLKKLANSDSHVRATLRIEDDGRGVAQEHLKQLFEAYTRGSSDADGTGLGLYICAELAVGLGGQIHYETSKHGGAAFVVSMELCKSSVTGHAVDLSKGAEDTFANKRVLLAEDDKTLQMLTARMLTKAGAQVCVCNNGEEALEVFESQQFDLVITDIMMPVLDGYVLARTLRARGYAGPIIGATAADLGMEIDELIAAGADAAISKPVTMDKLVNELKGVRPL